MAATNPPPDVMAYLAPTNVSVYDHLAQVVATVKFEGSQNPKADFDKVSRQVLESTLMWSEEKPPAKVDMVAQQANRDLFKVTKADADPVSAIVTQTERELDTYVPDMMGEAALLKWSGVSLGESEVCKVMLAIRKLATTHPEFKSVRFFGKMLGRNADYLICECEMTGPDELPPTGLPPNHVGRRNIEKVIHHNKLKYYVAAYPGAPWTALPNVRWDQLQAVGSIRKLLTGNPKAPFASYPPFPGTTEAEYLRAKIAYIAADTVLSPAGYFKEMPAEPEEVPPRPDNGIAFSGDWAPPETHADLEALLKIDAWAKHYPTVQIFDDPEMVKDEEGKWDPPAFEIEPYPIRATEKEVADLEEGNAHWTGRICAVQNKANAPIVLRSLRFPGAVVVAQGARFVCFYNGWGQEVNNKLVTPMLTTEIVCPQVAADDKYRVFLPKLYEDDPENPDADGNPGKKEIVREIPPPYPKEDWKTFNDEQEHLRDKMCLEFEALMEAERQAAEEARKLAEAEAVNSET